MYARIFLQDRLITDIYSDLDTVYRCISMFIHQFIPCNIHIVFCVRVVVQSLINQVTDIYIYI